MTQKISPECLLIGAHTSAAGGVHRALLEAISIGATTAQFFTANQKQWRGKPLSEESIALFKKTQQETGLQALMSHAGYLINLASPDPLLLRKSRQAFQEEIERCSTLELTFLNFHPGAATQSSREAGLDTIVESLQEMEEYFPDNSLRLLLETTAGQGTSLGWRFEELAYILEGAKERVPLGVCIDTCHIFAAGYDVRSADAWEKTLREFDQIIGLKHLYAFHINDSMLPLGSRRDRHANLGEGEIGFDGFSFLMSSSLTRTIPKYLETPGGMAVWDKEIWRLREFSRAPR